MDSDNKKITQLTVGFPAIADLVPYVSSPLSTQKTKAAYMSSFLGRGAILDNGACLVWDSATGYHVTPGSADVDGTFLTWSSNITRSSLTLTTTLVYYVYLYSNSGTPAVEESTTAPVWDSDLGYYKKTGDDTRRFIGYIQSEAANTVRKFLMVTNGRSCEVIYLDGTETGRQPVTTQNTTGSWASFSFSTLLPTNATHVGLLLKVICTTSGDDGTVGVSPADLGSSAANTTFNYVRGRAGANNANIFFGISWNPILTAGTYYYRMIITSGTPTTNILVEGCKFNR